MPKPPETVAIKDGDGKAIINKSDFDADTMEVYAEPSAAKKPAKKRGRPKKAKKTEA